MAGRVSYHLSCLGDIGVEELTCLSEFFEYHRINLREITLSEVLQRQDEPFCLNLGFDLSPASDDGFIELLEALLKKDFNTLEYQLRCY